MKPILLISIMFGWSLHSTVYADPLSNPFVVERRPLTDGTFFIATVSPMYSGLGLVPLIANSVVHAQNSSRRSHFFWGVYGLSWGAVGLALDTAIAISCLTIMFDKSGEAEGSGFALGTLFLLIPAVLVNTTNVILGGINVRRSKSWKQRHDFDPAYTNSSQHTDKFVAVFK